ncbi:MAG: MmgE/PrpD family protein [Rhizobiaceae bacterium]
MDALVSKRFARFASESDRSTFPPLARRRAVDAVTDCVGCILAGTAEASARAVAATLRFSREPSPLAESYVVGQGYASPMDAALYHGTAAHALDYDDTNHPGYAHPSASIVPALIAVAPLAACTGEDAVTAYVVGFEAIGKLGRALNTSHYARGWHPTGTFGAIGATLAACHLLKLPEPRIEVALAIAASQAGGLRANFGTMIKPLHAGLAARAGVTAALLAANGFDGAPDVFENRFGYLASFRGETAPVTEAITPGTPLEILTEFGLALKPYPSCGATHPGIEACCELHGWLDGRDIASVRVGYSEMARNPLMFPAPATPLQAKFSMEYCASAALLDGQIGLGSFTQEKVDRSEVSRLIRGMTVDVDGRVRDSLEFATVVGVTATDGARREVLVELAKGKPARWMAEADIRAKFFDCARHGGVAVAAGRILDLLRGLDREGDPDIARALMSLAMPHDMRA